MINIAVTCRGNSRLGISSKNQFDLWVSDWELGINVYEHRLGEYVRMGELQFTRITTSLDTRGETFDGVVRLSELAPKVERELIACMKPPVSLEAS